MANWYYYDNNTAEKRGPVSGSQLKALAASGAVLPDTIVEAEDGRQTPAGKLTGLFPAQEADSGLRFDTRPAAMQNVGQAITKAFAGNIGQTETDQPLRRQTYAVIAVFLGAFGVHDFYARHNLQGIVHLLFCGLLILGLAYNGFYLDGIDSRANKGLDEIIKITDRVAKICDENRDRRDQMAAIQKYFDGLAGDIRPGDIVRDVGQFFKDVRGYVFCTRIIRYGLALLFISWIWACLEIAMVRKDGTGVPMKE